MSTAPPLLSSDSTLSNVSSPSRRRHARGPSIYVLEIRGLERLFGTMDQDSQIVPIHAEFLTHFIFVALVQKNCPDQSLIAFRQSAKNLAHLFLHLSGRDNP